MTKDDIDFFTAGDILYDIRRMDEILGSDIFNPTNNGHPLTPSAFIELVICLRDLMNKTEKYGSRISFTEDVVITPNIKDVSDLIRFIRDALCHIHTYHHYVVPGRIKASFIILYGKLKHIPFEPQHDIILFSEYTDDVCFFFGLHKIYLRRHIIRALEEAKKQLLPLPEFPNGILEYGPPY